MIEKYVEVTLICFRAAKDGCVIPQINDSLTIGSSSFITEEMKAYDFLIFYLFFDVF